MTLEGVIAVVATGGRCDIGAVIPIVSIGGRCILGVSFPMWPLGGAVTVIVSIGVTFLLWPLGVLYIEGCHSRCGHWGALCPIHYHCCVVIPTVATGGRCDGHCLHWDVIPIVATGGAVTIDHH